ncbi:SAG family member [Eimeria brunetti]|uniref:SAG family member n=1 Tax=Eimeria brunetti TaxID=51314 RepID=U6LCX0_9EIME|nr:SAG family member [Eimeria brunetti]
MNSFCKTITAVCLVASSGLQSAAGASATYKWTAEDVTADACLSVNLARNGKLPVHINEVAKDEAVVTSLKNTVESKSGTATTSCEALMEGKEKMKSVFHYVLESQDEPDYSQLLQTSLDKGLKVFENKEYPQTDSAWQQTWQNTDFANLAYLLNSNSTKVGCVIGTCTKEQDAASPGITREKQTEVVATVFLCDLDPAATKDKAPFDQEYFTGLIARTAKLTNMTADDLKASTNDGTAAAAVPTVAIAGLLAVMTAVSA